jgi:hypothetical protein
MIIRNILILTVLAALVPTAMSNVSASAASEIALFSTASSDSNGLTISGNGDSAKMELKATNENGKSKRVSDFQMGADNVLYIKVGDKVTVKDNVDITKAIATDGNNNQKAIGITSDGVIDFTGYAQGVSTLDVVVDDDRAYEAIIVIGQQPPEVINKQVTKVNNNLETKVVYRDPCDEDEERIDGKCEPKCDEGQVRIGGECVDPYICIWYYDCPYPYEPEPEPVDCNLYPEHADCLEPEPEPEPIECGEGEELVDGQCQLIPENPEEPIIYDELVTVQDEETNDEGEESNEEEESEDEDSESEEESNEGEESYDSGETGE